MGIENVTLLGIENVTLERLPRRGSMATGAGQAGPTHPPGERTRTPKVFRSTCWTGTCGAGSS